MELHKKGALELDDVVSFNVDRAAGLAVQQRVTRNSLPTLTTHTSSLFVASVKGCVENEPDEQREFLRHVRNTEKLVAQGFPKSTHLFLSSACAQKAAGNAYPVPLMIAILHPLVSAFAKFDICSWPPDGVLAGDASATLSVLAARRHFAKPCPKADKEPKDASRLRRLSRRKRARVEATRNI